MAVIVCLIVALVLFVLAAVSWPQTGRFALGWAGLAFVTLALLLERGVL